MHQRRSTDWSLILSACVLLHGFSFAQDILFKNSHEEPVPQRPIDTDKERFTTNCRTECINLDECPELFALLLRPTRNNVKTLQNAACGFMPIGDPLVWCDRCDSFATNAQIHNDTGQSQAKLRPFRAPLPNNNENSVLRNLDIRNILNLEDCGTAFPGRISGGEAAAKGEFPWMVGITVHSSSGPQTICGGTLIADDWVITAAHCILDSSRHPRNISHVRVGAHNITKPDENGAENIAVSQVFFHDQFRERPVVKNDIALLKLRKRAVLGTTVGPICVPRSNDAPSLLYAPNSTAVIAGWGSDGHKPSYQILQKVEIPLVAGEVCKRLFQRVRVRVLPDFQVCAGAAGRDSCKGDSGGPIMKLDANQKSTLIGIISYGTVQCDGRLPGVYTKLTSYMNWITEIILKHS